ncbi:hypothetical protein SPRG_00744 [Saprolegnia parasitica CBS 223.65]|uniref:Cysteine/serine-rich nuclear protein N-terminal domain-containing protein n=1 Tax=Saprolegnia parasitica (strain CBS 223.65) TaxID=695850 RepID=A0A067CZM2_SAPPC|nr:hypothetical protein SPRG_00744 [Saprolegnia parasitica CBS 223.65]KDO34680.1 hypothetical protein SPRG_00744 [Saprolegnia parasitica CBS 223.65]|eukprot:XP_012194353.1 hypothetical protein SPRG_00744 [Saprolegnia parasitica CBS 223.65]
MPVTFGSRTTYLFGVDVNGSALPKESGPPIGLAQTHHTMTIERSVERLEKRRRRVRRFDHTERIRMLQTLYDAKTLATFCYEAIDSRKERLETAEELAQAERCLAARRRKRAAEMAPPAAKRQRMVFAMEYDEDEDEDDEDDDE